MLLKRVQPFSTLWIREGRLSKNRDSTEKENRIPIANSMKSVSLAGQEIEGRSLDIVDGLLPPLSISWEERQVVIRLVHTCGDPSLAQDVVFHPEAIKASIAALKKGSSIFTDVMMVYTGIDVSRAKALGCKVYCALSERKGEPSEKQTRAGAAMRSLGPRLDGALVAIGNAPTALLSVLDIMDSGIARPAALIGMPVGFVASKESKEELMKRDIPFIAIKGTRGGSPLAAAAVNALLRLAVELRN